MIDKNNFNRIKRVVRKCQAGIDTSTINPSSSITTLVNDKIRGLYARQNNLTFKDGKFFKTDENGEEVPENVDQQALIDFALKEQNRQNLLMKASNFIDSADKLLFAGNEKVNDQSTLTQGLNMGYDTAADKLSKAGGLASVIGEGMKIGGFASDTLTAVGVGTDQMTGVDKVFDSKFLKLTPLGLVNALGGEKSDNFSFDYDTASQVGGSYGGTVNNMYKAENMSNKKYGAFSSGARHRANDFIRQITGQENTMANIAKTAKDQSNYVNAMGDLASKAYGYQLTGGFQPTYLHVKQGGKLPEDITKEEPEDFVVLIVPPEDVIVPGNFKEGGIISEKINPTTGQIEEWRPEVVEVPWQPDIVNAEILKAGGKVEKQLDAPEIEETTQKNLIPEGALHKNKHHMKNAEDLTKKGIPVVDNKNQQQAEIEKNEIIFTKEVTQKLEELYKIYYSEDSTQKEKDEAALNAGKLLTKEIILNTDDRTGLIDTLASGGKIGKENKPSYEDWVADVNPRFLNDNYDLKTAYENLPFEQMEKWKNAVAQSPLPEGTDWHLPSVYQIDNDTIIFLKLGKTVKENPELQYEFDEYNNTPELKRNFKMVFNKDENRWYYKRRKTTK